MQKQIELTDKTVLVMGLPSKIYLKSIGIFIDDEKLIKCKLSHMLGVDLLCLYDGHVKSEKVSFRGKHGHIFNIELPNGDWKLVGIHPELTEEECSLFMPKAMGQHYINHNSKQIYDRWCKTAKEAFDTLMQKLEIPEGKFAVLIRKK